jgi:hypothetical protein
MTDINFYSAVAKPGDTLVVAVPNLPTVGAAESMAAELEKLLPNIRVVVICAHSLAAIRPDDVV